MNTGIIDLDLHGFSAEDAKKKIDTELKRVGSDVYRLRLIHGYHGGTGIKSMVQDEYSYGRHEKVLRIESGWNQGITELVLREFYN